VWFQHNLRRAGSQLGEARQETRKITFKEEDEADREERPGPSKGASLTDHRGFKKHRKVGKRRMPTSRAPRPRRGGSMRMTAQEKKGDKKRRRGWEEVVRIFIPGEEKKESGASKRKNSCNYTEN